jgi:hypothetical protein
MLYKSNAQSVLDKLKKTLRGELDNMYLEIAEAVYASNIYRIHTQGKKTDGSLIGKYNPVYAKYRRSLHLQTSKVNLELRGRLRADLKLKKSSGGYTIGFTGSYGSNISTWMEEKYGGEIWGISKSDSAIMKRIIKKYINKINA